MRLRMIVLLGGILITGLLQAQVRYPYSVGYLSSNVQQHVAGNDTMQIGFSSSVMRRNQIDSKSWVKDASNNSFMMGFRPDMLYVETAFGSDLWASKGYFADFVEIRWDLIRYENQVTRFKIYRKVYGSDADSVEVGSVSGSERSWRDEFAESGVLYKYYVNANGITPVVRKFFSYVEGVGFRVPTGQISGRVTFKGGGAVENVEIIAETEDDFDGRSMMFNGTNDAFLQVPNNNFDFTNDFSFQSWIKPSTNAEGTIFNRKDQYEFTCSRDVSNQLYTFRIKAGSNALTSFEVPFKPDTFIHAAFVKQADTLFLYAKYNSDSTYSKKIVITANTVSTNSNDLFFGKKEGDTKKYSGYIDEIRLWEKALSKEEIEKNYSRFISGGEKDIVAYYRLNEIYGDNFYDLARKGFAFQENHGEIGKNVAIAQTVIPKNLRVKGITDNNGNYIISGIPYKSDGSNYRFVPTFGVHTFDPTEKIMFIGPGAAVANNVDFIDVASFPVSGNVFYHDTRVPVQGVSVLIDGNPVVKDGGLPVLTNSEGSFTVDVPIGYHVITLNKANHVFVDNGRFPKSSDDPNKIGHNFVGNISEIPYTLYDSTTVKVVGRLVAGSIMRDKPKVFNRTENKLGDDLTIELKLTGSGDLLKNNEKATRTYSWNNEYYNTDTLFVKSNQKTTVKVPYVAGVANNKVTIHPDATTGEFVAYLLPEEYEIVHAKGGKYQDGGVTKYHNILSESHFDKLLNLKNTFRQTEIDTVKTPTNVYVDSLSYQYFLNLVYHVTPTLVVEKKTNEPVFWEREITMKKGGVKLKLVDDNNNLLTDYPIFQQSGKYTIQTKVQELFETKPGGEQYSVPVTKGNVIYNNEFSEISDRKPVPLDSNGVAKYEFKAGLPNILPPFTKTLTITAETGNKGAIKTKWMPPTSSGYAAGKDVFKGVIIGARSSGSNFVTTGPNKVDMVIRDPFGGSSYAWYESGNTITETETWDVNTGVNLDTETEIDAGAEIVTWVGVGGGTINTVETIAGNKVGVGVNTEGGAGGSKVNTLTSTKRWETSSDAAFVGSMGDVYIGHSTNLVFGMADLVNFRPVVESKLDAVCGAAPDRANCLSAKDKANKVWYYKLQKDTALTMSPEFGTMFQYSQNHIVNYLIPNFKKLRKLFIENEISKGDASNYRFDNLAKPGQINYGKNNTIYYRKESKQASDILPKDTSNFAIVNDAKTQSHKYGNYYNIVLNVPSNWPRLDTNFVDSVKWYNDNILAWENIIRQNEKEKITGAGDVENKSFDAGVVFTDETTVSDTKTSISHWQVELSGSFTTELGFEAFGMGLTTTLSVGSTTSTGGTSEDETTTEITFGYELSDPDEGDYFSMDVKKPKGNVSSPMFYLKGGQSSCPHEGGDKVLYYTEGGKEYLNEATMAREVPQITCENRELINIPEDKPAYFSVDISNQPFTGDAGWFTVSVVDDSNPHGAAIKMDGASIKDGRVIFVQANDPVTKVITIEKGLPSVNEYHDIGIVLRSICQSDPGDNWPDISDTVKLSASFIPVCSPVSLKKPNDNWVKNVGHIDTTSGKVMMEVEVGDLNLAHNTLEKVVFQSSPTFTDNWTTRYTWYKENNQAYQAAVLNAPSKNDTIIPSKPYQELNWLMDISDRGYKLRAKTICTGIEPIESISEVKTGILDTRPPRLFGTPQPGDGILSIGEDVQIKFNEDIVPGALVKETNFTVRGVKNGAKTGHEAALYFNGVDAYATVQKPVNLTDKSFSIQFWTKRGDLNAGTIFKQGEIEIGFDANNSFQVKLGSGNTFTSAKKYGFTNEWVHYTVTFDYEAKKIKAYAFYGSTSQQDVLDDDVVNSFVSTGVLNLGKGEALYNGLIHDLRVWEKVVGYGEASATNNDILKGGELQLSGLWLMDDLSGKFAEDKSRAHHAVLHKAEWKIFPIGFAKNLDGNSAISIKTGTTVTLTDAMDFTIEFWFKGNVNQKDKVLFSNGKPHTLEPISKIWEVGFNNQGKLYATNNGVTMTDDIEEAFLDNQWHHFALVMRRHTNAAIYVDGNVEVTETASSFGELTGAEMTIGASNSFGANKTNFEKFFTGKIDEFRIWKLARTKKLLELDMHSKLIGDEMGLVAYYPFEKYNSSGSLVGSLNSMIINTFNGVSTADTLVGRIQGTESYDNNDVAKIKPVRPIEKLSFDYVASEREIVIELNEPGFQIENTIVEFTAEEMEDLAGNKLASPVTWTAYIKQNPVLWNEQVLNFEKLVNEPLSFEVEILNIGGSEENFTISNLPNWLTASELEGSMGPVSQKTIHFEVNPLVNIGTHELAIHLSTDYGFHEVLLVNLKVIGNEPDWNFNPGNFELSMSVVGQIAVDDIISFDEDDKLLAVQNGVVRGIANLTYVDEYDLYFAFLDVYSNDSTGTEQISFYVWDASEGKTHVEVQIEDFKKEEKEEKEVVLTTLFEENKLLGTPSNPKVFAATNNMYEPIDLKQGWNWISFHLDAKDNKRVTDLLKDLDATHGDKFRGRRKYVEYDANIKGWIGNLKEVNNIEMYKLKSAKLDTISYVGRKVKSQEKVITLKEGWNWIGFPLLVNLSLEDAFSNLLAENGDIIKGQNGFAVYDEKIGWIGTLESLKPKSGYMYYLEDRPFPDTVDFSFPDGNLFKSGKTYRDEVLELYTQRKFEFRQYRYNASLIAKVDILEGLAGEFVLEAYQNNELRGICPIRDGKFYMDLYGEEVENLNFMLLDAFGNRYSLDESIAFERDQITGSLTQPFVFKSNESLKLPTVDHAIVVSPTIYNDFINITYHLADDKQVSIDLYDIAGKHLATILDNTQLAGSHKIHWTTEHTGIKLPSGMQFLKIRMGDELIKVEKLIKAE